MFTIISFILTLLGSVNWLMIGLLQYDFVAGIFGYQASVFSRIIYIIIGASSVFLVYKLIKGKGTLAVFSRRNKKDIAKRIEEMQHKDEPVPANSYNVEAGQENINHSNYDYDDEFSQYHSQHSLNREVENNNKPRGLFDEHFDERG